MNIMQQSAKRGLTRFSVITFVFFLFLLAGGFMVANFVFAQTAPALQNDKLPEFIEWAKTYDIKLIGTKRSGQYIENNMWNSATDEIPLTAIGGINSVFEDLKKIPSHLISTLRGNAIFFSSGSDNCQDRAGLFLRQIELTQKYQKAYAELPREIREEGRRTYIPAGILDIGYDTYVYPYDIFLCMPGGGNAIHEFGHIVDLNGIRMFNGRETAIGKSDEETRQLYAEYERIFGVNKLSPGIRRQWQNSTSTMPGILNNWGLQGDDENFAFSFNSYVKEPQFSRDKAAKDSGVAEKYEFLKNKIFLGKEYFEEKSVITAPAPASTRGGTPTITTPTQTSSAQVEALKTQIQALQDQIAKFQVQLNEIQKIESKTTPTPVATPAQTNVFIKTLQRGIRDGEVKQLQEFLRQYPEIYPEGLITGYFGSFTEKAVKKFQEKYSIESIGIVGPKTRAKLNEFISVQPLSIPTSPPAETAKPKESIKPEPTPTSISTSTSTSIPSPTSQFQSGPPATWPDWLKQERTNNIEDVLKAEEFMRNAGRKSILNDNLPQFIEWAKEREINLVGIKETGESKSDFWNLTARKMSLTAVPGIDERFEMFKKLPERLLNIARGQAIFFWGKDCIGYVSPVWRNEELSQRYQKKDGDVPADVRCTYAPEGLSFSWGGSCLSPYDMFVCKGIGLEIHEFGHVVDFNGIRMYKGREFTLGKTDEGIRELYNEYGRVFEPTEEQRNWKRTDQPPPGMLDYGQANSLENFAVHFDYYVRRPEQFREKAAQNSGLAEKYEFLKTKIFLGKEY